MVSKFPVRAVTRLLPKRRYCRVKAEMRPTRDKETTMDAIRKQALKLMDERNLGAVLVGGFGYVFHFGLESGWD